MDKKYRVKLTIEECEALAQRVGSGKEAERMLNHACVLLIADEGAGGPGLADVEVADASETGVAMVARVRQRFVEHGLQAALVAKPTARAYARKLDNG